jgi:hypothetical protein
MNTEPRYFGILGGLMEMMDIQQETGCSFEEARERWRAIHLPEPDNVIHVDFSRKDR